MAHLICWKRRYYLHHRNYLNLGLLAIGLCLTLSAHFAYADTLIYKWVDKNGVTSYSQNPPTDAGEKSTVTTITVESLPPAQQRAAARVLANLQKLSDASTAARQQRIQAADKRIAEALDRLQAAEKKLSDGSTPTGFDRVGNVDGRARLRDSYFERVSRLQADVDQAQQALNDAYTARDQP